MSAGDVMTTPATEGTPVFTESIGAALIDSARISVMAAMSMLPAPLIITLPEEVLDPDEAAASVHGCLEQAMQWLDGARVITVQQGAPVTSLHVVGLPGEAKCLRCGCTEERPCAGGCGWVAKDPPICSRCA